MAVTNRVTIVTGAGSGIGRAVSLRFAEDGYDVVLAGRRRERLEETAALAAGLGGCTLVSPTDVRKPEQVAHLFSSTVETFDRLDVLFNNAGGNFARGILLEDIDLEDWNATIETNLTGAFLCTQEAFRVMKTQHPVGGRIINNGSVSAHSPRPDFVAYTASKHGITGLTKQTSLDGRKYDITCGQIDIGNASVPHNVGTTDEHYMDVRDVANGVLYMANLPPEANVLFLTVTASKMPFIGRG